MQFIFQIFIAFNNYLFLLLNNTQWIIGPHVHVAILVGFRIIYQIKSPD
jgi:hypothetical protein